MKKLNFKTLVALFTFFFFSGCSLITDSYQVESKKILEYLLADMPIPESAEVQKTPTVILGTGNGIAGRIVLKSNESPASNLIFYGNETIGTGWTLASSTVAEEIVLVYTKEGRYATIEILKDRSGFGNFLSGENSSDITISVIHPDSIMEQNPYLALDPKKSNSNIVNSN